MNPQPKMKIGDRGKSSTPPRSVMRAGVFVSPAPRNAAESRATAHIRGEPIKIILEYFRAASKAKPVTPIK
ncbi:hypothetical protein D9M71_737950 [compost metagenome]